MNLNQELRNNLTTASELAQVFPDIKINDRIEEILEKYPISIPQYYLSLIDKNNLNDPIRRMSVPSFSEMDLDGSFDTSGENDNTVIKGLQHKYSQTVLLLSTHCCAMYCRYCFRKRMVGATSEEIAIDLDRIFDYIREHKEISNVLISGGDSFMLETDVIEKYLKNLSEIEHLDYIRFGTKVPVVFPDRIINDSQLLDLLKKYCNKKQIYISTQFNHSNEITPQSIKAIRLLQQAGLIIKNQTVLLKGINDNPEVLGALLKNLTKIGIVPYYIFQCRPVSGVKNQFQVPLLKGYEIVEKAKGLQNGNGKCLRYAMSNTKGKVEIIGKGEKENEMIFKFHQAKNKENQSRIFTRILSENDCWVDD